MFSHSRFSVLPARVFPPSTSSLSTAFMGFLRFPHSSFIAWWENWNRTPRHMEVSWNRGTPVHHPFLVNFPSQKPTSSWGSSIYGKSMKVPYGKSHGFWSRFSPWTTNQISLAKTPRQNQGACSACHWRIGSNGPGHPGDPHTWRWMKCWTMDGKWYGRFII